MEMPSALLLVAVLLVELAGCVPTCKQTCRKLLTCDSVETPKVSLDECTSQCEIQKRLYASWTDTELQQRFDDLRVCIQQSSCAELSGGACYDENLFVW